MQNFINYLKETKSEMKHVSWPSKAQTTAYTILVVLLSLFIAFLLGAFDAGFRKAVEMLITK